MEDNTKKIRILSKFVTAMLKIISVASVIIFILLFIAGYKSFFILFFLIVIPVFVVVFAIESSKSASGQRD